MQASIDTTNIDEGPIVDNKIEIALFYIFFVVVFSFFFINIFVALIILTFQEQGEKDQGDCELDRNQVRKMHPSVEMAADFIFGIIASFHLILKTWKTD